MTGRLKPPTKRVDKMLTISKGAPVYQLHKNGGIWDVDSHEHTCLGEWKFLKSQILGVMFPGNPNEDMLKKIPIGDLWIAITPTSGQSFTVPIKYIMGITYREIVIKLPID